MFAQGPQKEKSPLTHEGLEPQRLRGRARTHTRTSTHNAHTRTNKINTTLSRENDTMNVVCTRKHTEVAGSVLSE